MKQKRLLSWCAFLLALFFTSYSFLSSVANHRERALLNLEKTRAQEKAIYRENEMLAALRQKATEISESVRQRNAMSWEAPSRSEALLKFQEQIRITLRTSNLNVKAFETLPEGESPQALQMRIHASGSLESIQSTFYYLESNLPSIEIQSISLRTAQASRSEEGKLTLEMQLRGAFRIP